MPDFHPSIVQRDKHRAGDRRRSLRGQQNALPLHAAADRLLRHDDGVSRLQRRAQVIPRSTGYSSTPITEPSARITKIAFLLATCVGPPDWLRYHFALLPGR